MKKIKIIPCMDVNKGRVVKGIKFVDLRDAGDPVENARRYCESGADELVFLDITATTENRATVIDMVRKVAPHVTVPFTVGGGIRCVEDFAAIIEAGADKAGVNTAAVLRPQLIDDISKRFSSARLTVAIDVKHVGNKYIVLTGGGKTETDIEMTEWAKQCEARGAGEILLTSLDRDGTKSGYDCEMYKSVTSCVGIPVIASGGAGTLRHFYDVVVQGGVDAVLAASLFHFREVDIVQLKRYLRENGIEVYDSMSRGEGSV